MAEISDLDRLVAIEEIKRVKARYCRAVDQGNLDDWRNVFTEDAAILNPDTEEYPDIHGVESIISMGKAVLTGIRSAHHLHAPEIDILSPTEAEGIWALEDHSFWHDKQPNAFGAERTMRGFGHYHEKYRKTQQGWRISEMQLKRIYMERDGEPLGA